VVHVDDSAEGHGEDHRVQADVLQAITSFPRQEGPREDSENSLVKIVSRKLDQTDDKVCTVVTVSAPGSPLVDVHRLQIKGEYPTKDMKPGAQKRTSILINSEDSSKDTKHIGLNTSGNSVTSFKVQDDVRISHVKNDDSNKVTISVGIVSEPLVTEGKNQNVGNTYLSSSCTVIGTSTRSRLNSTCDNNVISSTSFSSDQVNIIPVSPEQKVERTLLLVNQDDNNESSNHTLLLRRTDEPPTSGSDGNNNKAVSSEVQIVEGVERHVQNPTCKGILLPKSRGIGPTSTSINVNEEDILLNPVEAVRRNLVPHICGRKDSTTNDKGTDELEYAKDVLSRVMELDNNEEDNEQETLKEDYLMANAVSELKDLNTNEDIPVYPKVSSTTVSKSSEDTLPTVIEQTEGDDDVPQSFSLTGTGDRQEYFVSLDEERCKLEDENLSGESGGFNTAPSSVEAENEGTVRKEEDTGAISTSQLSPSLRDFDSHVMEKDDEQNEVGIRDKNKGTSSEIINQNDDENIYESIRDPIYEEIPDTPPPLPLSPPPSLDDLEEIKKGSRSIFEGASKYDILSYLVGAKERGIVHEEGYYSGNANSDEVIEIIDVKPNRDDDDDGGSQSHQRMTSLDLGDLSSRVSHLSNASDSSEDSCNLIICSIGDDASSPNKVLCCGSLDAVGIMLASIYENGRRWLRYMILTKGVGFSLQSLKNGVFWHIKTQFVLHRRHITSPLQSPAS
jgi:hypothetical protein